MAAMVSEKMMDPTPTQAPPPLSRNSSQRFSGELSAGSSLPEAPDRSSSSTPSPSRQLDPQSQLPTREEEYRQLFRLPTDEVLIQDFNCALQENFLLQGHMYVFVHCICFYSNLFGFETKKIIPFNDITSVRRAKAVAVFPTAIEIIAGGKKYFFTSFLFRDEAYKLINEGWLQHERGSKDIIDQQEPKSDAGSQENGSYVDEESGSAGQSLDEPDVTESDNKSPILEEFKHLADDESEIIPTSSVMEVKEEPNALSAPIIECSSSQKSSTWEPEPADAPGVPEGYTKVAESKFPVRAEEFFNLFFSDASLSFHESFRSKCGDKDFKCSSWNPHEKFGHSRDLSFQHPIKIYFGARFGSCQEVQKYRVYRNCHLIIDTSQTINDVPYGDYFTVEGRWDLEQEGNDSTVCNLKVYTNVAFSKKTMWKGKIVQSTVEECREAYAIWIDLAHETLKQKNLEKGGVSAPAVISTVEAQPENQAILQQHLEPMASDVRISATIPDVNNMYQRVTDHPQRNANEALSGSLFRGTLAKFYTSIKHMSTPSLLLVVTVVVILVLMQISILVLLSRPQRIHVIPQAGCANGMENRGEALASVSRQMRYLKDEMQFVETLLDKLQNEHAQLKGKIRELEVFRNQRI